MVFLVSEFARVEVLQTKLPGDGAIRNLQRKAPWQQMPFFSVSVAVEQVPRSGRGNLRENLQDT